MKLVIIEGPGKRDTIKKYLGSGYEVFATKGHIRDLPEKSFGVNLTTFEPEYQIMSDKQDVIKTLKNLAAKAEEIYLATDPDREGEAISWHIANILGLDMAKKCRVVINEISKDSVLKAIENPRAINLDLVNAQQTRRILDRVVGYKLSPIISKKIQPKLSAGRVQSVALKLVVEREEEIRNFKPQEYWNIAAMVKSKKQPPAFKSYLISYKNNKAKPKSKAENDEIVAHLQGKDFVVKSIKKTKTKSKVPAPFTTSTMQQDALNKLGMNLKKTSSCAQALYEGVELGSEGKVALITYIRSDSTRVAPQAQFMAREYILEKYGKDYAPAKFNVFSQKESSQDAHEAIRPISLAYTPEKVKAFLTPDNYKLYKLIFERFVASQMTQAVYNNVIVEIEAGQATFKSVGKTLEFAGWTAVYASYIEEDNQDTPEEQKKIPVLTEGEVVDLVSLDYEQKFTKPPIRYTEASLVKAMEEKGIGRPATYAPTITLLANRKYTDKDGKYLIPTELGEKITKYLNEFFLKVINVEFTAGMENKLDEVAENKAEWKAVVSKFWNFFKELIFKADKSEVTYKKEPVLTEEICEKCGSKMALRTGPYGEFLGCSNYPTCKNTVQIKKPEKHEGVCPLCKKPTLIRKTKKGTEYYSCSGYPDCKFMSWEKPTGQMCPTCNKGFLTEKKNIIKCSECDYKHEKHS
ncbi:MAG: type I DNA topoisomerase [Christensenellales bacterium]|jgi:DNA topoisomerase-1